MKTVLIVDDDPFIFDTIIPFLRDRYRIRIAINGTGALKQIEREKPDIVLLDIQMPGMNGFEVCESIKANQSTKDIPVIFHSSLDEEFVIKHKEIPCANGYIKKPSSPNYIIYQLERFL